MKKPLAALVALIAVAGTVQAAETAPKAGAPHAYAGIGAVSADRIDGASKVDPRLFGGYAFSDSLALEGGYVDFSKAAVTATPAPQARTIDLGGFGMYVAARLTRPLMEKLSAYAKLGVAHSQRKLGTGATGGTVRKASDTGAYGAFGLQYSVTQKVAVSAGYERFGKDKPAGAKADAWTFGLEIEF